MFSLMFKQFPGACLIGLTAGTLALLLWFSGILDGFEYSTWTWRVNLLARPSAHTAKIKIIAIDQYSLDWVQENADLSWPWPRQVYAPILSFLGRAGARVVVFDMIFEQPSRAGVADDRAFASAITTGPPFVGVVSLDRKNGLNTWPEWSRGFDLKGLQKWEAETGTSVTYKHARFPVPELGMVMNRLGNVIEEPDADGIVRRVHLFRGFAGRAVPSLALAAYLSTSPGEAKIAGSTLVLGGNRVPLDRNGGAILRFRGPRGTHDKFSAAAVIQSETRIRMKQKPVISPDEFKDCYVFFMPTASGTHDLKVTPVGSRYPGGEVHATALDNLLARDFLRSTPAWLTIISTLLITLFSAGAAFRPARTWLTAAAFFALLLPVGLAAGAYELGLWWPVIPQILGVLMAVAGVLVLKYATEGRERRFIRQAFQHYLSPDVITHILQDPSKLSLGGERRELSIFFSDLQGFTSISEKLDAGELTTLLNDYLSDMTDIILDLGGTLDKYEGDAIIAFWNAPLDQDDHALRAVRAAVKCQRKLAERRPEFQERTGQVLRMRIGVHTGEVVVGNLGSRRRFDYTVLGDAANLASRLEGANKALGTYTMVSSATWEQALRADPDLVGRELGDLRVVGREKPVRVFEPLGSGVEIRGSDLAAAREFERGLRLCRAGKWPEAAAVFCALAPEPAAVTYADKCGKLAQSKEGQWDGVWNLTSK